ncbi:MAG: hypothetical protein RL026_267 [Pseudomonadota bacterium]|jgi:hypothetical protein
MPLCLIVADLHLDPAAASGASSDGQPGLPAVEHVLRWGRARAVTGWRKALAQVLGRPALADVPPARIVASLPGWPPMADPWLAVPVHRLAALDHLRLPPQGLVALADDELDVLCSSFAKDFAAQGLSLHAAFGSLLLQGSGLDDVLTMDPAKCLGGALRPEQLAGGPRGPALRRLSAEIEMWLHDHRINGAREARGLPAINGLWLWGGGPAANIEPQSGPLPATELFADEAWPVALGRLCGQEAQPVPVEFADLDLRVPAVLVCSASRALAAGGGLAELERRFIAPARAAVDSGRLDVLRLAWSGQLVEYRRVHRWRLWRRPRAWWQGAA